MLEEVKDDLYESYSSSSPSYSSVIYSDSYVRHTEDQHKEGFMIKPTGFSTPFLGLSWDYSQSEKEIVRGLLVYLEGKRILTSQIYRTEYPNQCVASVLQIKDKIAEIRAKRKFPDDVDKALADISDAANRYLDNVAEDSLWNDSITSRAAAAIFGDNTNNLLRFREAMSDSISFLESRYGIVFSKTVDVEGLKRFVEEESGIISLITNLIADDHTTPFIDRTLSEGKLVEFVSQYDLYKFGYLMAKLDQKRQLDILEAFSECDLPMITTTHLPKGDILALIAYEIYSLSDSSKVKSAAMEILEKREAYCGENLAILYSLTQPRKRPQS